jgi:uncharacterized protein (TIGR03032 family)
VTEPAPISAEALGSVHTSNFPRLLERLHSSLLISTLECAQTLIVVRCEGAALHTDFIALNQPMGMVVDSNRIVVGGWDRVYEFRNMPAFSAGSVPLEAYDAVYLMRNVHVTGALYIHEIALAGEECWCVNTRFSCLCTLDQVHSFVPRWRPPFVTGYAPGDRCHLNGLAVHEGRPRFVTAFGESNTVEGWRANKRDGGVVIDVDSGETIVRGLFLPHSPRLYRDRLWLLESGKGSLATVDVATGKLETVVRLPGFTRGLDFAGPFAFVGLSQVRAASSMSVDIAVTAENPERASGVWVVNIETGKTVAFLRFSGMVEELYAVHLMRGTARPHVSAENSPALETTWVLPEAARPEVELAAAAPPSYRAS